MLTRRLLAVLCTLGLVVLGASPAAAGLTSPVKCQQEPSAPECTVHVGTPGSPRAQGTGGDNTCRDPSGQAVPCFVPGAGWLADDGCYYQPATGASLQAAEAAGGQASGSSQWYVGECGYPHGIGMTRYRQFATAPSVQVVAAQAVNALRLPLPAVRLNPASPVRQVVRLPMWVWLDNRSWGARSATASVPGLSVTATATATQLVFAAGDGTTVTCQGPGTTWTAGADPKAASPTCGHTYTAAGTFTLGATVTWSVTWAGGGQAGTVPAVTTAASVPVMVTEVAALDTRTGER